MPDSGKKPTGRRTRRVWPLAAIVLSAADRERTAYHEAGHALAGMLNPDADPVRKVSIIPRGAALGVTFSSPEAERFSHDEDYLRARLQVALGGRVAEEIVFGVVSTGAESDIAQLTEVARAMVGRWGMSSAIGPLLVLPDPSRATPFGPADGSSEETRRVVDAEARRLVEESVDAVHALLVAHRNQLDALATALMDHETLDEAEAYVAAGIPGASNGRPFASGAASDLPKPPAGS